MTQEANTIRNLLGKVETLEMGFEMAKTMFHDPDVREALIERYLPWSAIVKGLLSKGQSYPRNSLLGRVERYLQIMEMIDNDGNRIEDA